MTPIAPLIEKHLPAIRALRRDLHAHPEPGYHEVETARKVVAHLASLAGFELRTGVAQTGVVATLSADRPGPCVALRADMDCLPIHEETGAPYASTRPGFMHACGHDGHTAALVGAALVLHELRDELGGPVRFLFQPAEEGGFGGRRMCAEGALENPRVEAVFGLHNSPAPDLQFGDVALRPGPLMGGGVVFRIAISGRGGHAASPHQTIDPIAVGSQVVMALQTLVSRRTSPFETLVVSVTQFHAGTTNNVIPDTAFLEGTIRSLSPELLRTAPEQVRDLALATAAAHGATATVELTPGYPVTVNDARAAAYCTAVARAVAGPERVHPAHTPTLGSEDFSFYLQQRPGCFYFVGTRPPEVAAPPGLHHPKFDFNDDALPLAIAMHVEVARRFAAEWPRTTA